jgi:dTMP kinase
LTAGCFIVLEGGEGAGKSSAIAVLAAALRDQGRDVLTTREPGGTPEGLALRALLLAEDAPPWDGAAELLLMTAARVQHVRRLIEPALRAGRVVLCDRYLGSTLAYQGAGRGLPAALILDLHHRAAGGLLPHLTVLLDLDPRAGLARSRRRLGLQGADEARFESLDLAFHERVRASFLRQAASAPTVVIDAAQAQDAVQRHIVAQVQAWLAASHPTWPIPHPGPPQQ